MVKLFPSRRLTPWEKEILRAEKENYAERKGSLAPAFTPRDGVYEYSRNFDYKGKNRKGSTYHAVLRLSFSPASDYGWIITGCGKERLSVHGIVGGQPRAIRVDDGRITPNGKFYWKEIREKGVEVLVMGCLEPHYHLSNGKFTIDDRATFHASHLVNSAVDLGQLTRKPLKHFRRIGELEIASPMTSPRVSSPRTGNKKSAIHNAQSLKQALQSLMVDDSVTEELSAEE